MKERSFPLWAEHTARVLAASGTIFFATVTAGCDANLGLVSNALSQSSIEQQRINYANNLIKSEKLLKMYLNTGNDEKFWDTLKTCITTQSDQGAKAEIKDSPGGKYYQITVNGINLQGIVRIASGKVASETLNFIVNDKGEFTNPARKVDYSIGTLQDIAPKLFKDPNLSWAVVPGWGITAASPDGSIFYALNNAGNGSVTANFRTK